MEANDTNITSSAIDVSLTSFADFVLKSGLPKLTCAQQIRVQYERGYNPAFDYYKKFRDTTRRLHESGVPMSNLESELQSIADPNKGANYEILARGYTRFWHVNMNDHGFAWRPPPVAEWTYGNLRVRVNPELAFTDGTANYFVKLYCKEDQLTKPQVQVILHLMQLSLRPKAQKPVVVILDVRRGRPHEATVFNPRWTVVLEAEALAFERMYRTQLALAEIPD
jgi:uncharacterized membrane protein